MQTVKLIDFAAILGISKSTMLLYSQSYLWNEFVKRPQIIKPGRCYEYSTITLNEYSIPIIRKYLEIKSRSCKVKHLNIIEKFDEYIKKPCKISRAALNN